MDKETTMLLPPVKEVLERFPQVFKENVSYSSPLGAAWAPGRVNIIGEHTDYNAGFVLPLAVDRVSAFAGRTRADCIVRLWSTHFQEYAQFTVEGLPATFEQQREQTPSWARYVLGVLTELARAGLEVNGFDAVISGDVPLGGGMSSSAALEVATTQAAALFSQGNITIGEHDASLSLMDVAALCQRAEHIASKLRSGILDQAASCLGKPQHAVLLDCRSLDYRYLPFADPSISIVVIDTSVRRELASSAYNKRREQCEEATRRIRDMMLRDEPGNAQAREIKALRDVTPEQFARYKDELPQVLQKRAGYVIAEDARVLQVAKLLEADDVVAVGPILWQGHAGLRYEYEVSCKELDVLVDIAQQVPGVLGGRMMGGGFGGCTVNLVRNEAVEAFQRAVEDQYEPRTGRKASIDICRAAAGPGYTFSV